jgi:hypothetical protein
MRCRPGGSTVPSFLEDPDQNLYGRPTLPLPGWVTLHSNTNSRYLRQVAPGIPINEVSTPRHYVT